MGEQKTHLRLLLSSFVGQSEDTKVQASIQGNHTK